MILTALQSAAKRLVGRNPSTFFGAQQQFEMELCDLVNEVATDVAAYQDWQALIRTYDIAGNGALTEYPLPADYDRMMVNSDVQNTTNWLWGYFGFTDINEYLLSQARNFTPWPGGWIIYGNKFRFSPAPMNASTARFPYISKNWATSSVGIAKPAFDSDTDTFALPERLLTLGLVWRWRENKKLDYTGDMEAFTKALDEYGTKDAGSKVIRFGRSRRFGSVPYMGYAY